MIYYKSIYLEVVLIILFTSCKNDEQLPKVVTTPIVEVTYAYAISGGEILDDGNSNITAKGICCTTDENIKPTVDNCEWLSSKGTGTESFVDTINAQWFGAAHRYTKTHYIRAYATNSAGTAYGKLLSFTPKAIPPVFSSLNVTNITTSSATFNYQLYSASSSFIIDEAYLCIGTSPNPSIDGYHTPINYLSADTTINNLTPNTTYYARGYVKNESGFTYSDEVSFTTWEGLITDYEGNVYQTKTIGNQVWTLKNLESTKFSDGSQIPVIQDNLLWDNTTSSACCDYPSFGKLYNYYAVVDSRNLCPTGWHIPSDDEWKTLEKYLEMSQSQADETGLRGTNEGGYLKAVCLSIYDGWKFPNTGATNSSSFTALGAGYRSDNGIFSSVLMSANFWTKSEFDASSAWSRSLSYDNSQIIRLNIKKEYGFSVRCVKD